MNQNVIIKKIKLHKRDYRLDQVQRDNDYCYAFRERLSVWLSRDEHDDDYIFMGDELKKD